jgi:hypothetical protein
MEPNIIDKMVKVVKVHYMNRSALTNYHYCIKIELHFLHPVMYVNGYETSYINVYDSLGVFTEEVYNALFGLYKYCGVSREELLLWVVSKIDFDKSCNKKMYSKLLLNFIT